MTNVPVTSGIGFVFQYACNVTCTPSHVKTDIGIKHQTSKWCQDINSNAISRPKCETKIAKQEMLKIVSNVINTSRALGLQF